MGDGGVDGLLALLDAQTVSAAGASVPAVGAVLVRGPYAAAATAAHDLAAHWSALGCEARTACPDGDRWTVEDLDTGVVAAAALRPLVRNVIVVTRAGAMPAATADHLLRVLEEPPAATTFVLVVDRADTLPAAVVGRCATVIDVAGADEATLAAVCRDAGFDDMTARTLAGGGPGDVSIGLGLGPGHPAIDALRALRAEPLWGAEPAARAARVIAACTAIADAAEGDTKAVVRDLVRTQLAVWSDEIRRRLAGVTTAAGWKACEQAAVAIADARTRLALFSPPPTVVAAVTHAAGGSPPR